MTYRNALYLQQRVYSNLSGGVLEDEGFTGTWSAEGPLEVTDFWTKGRFMIEVRVFECGDGE